VTTQSSIDQRTVEDEPPDFAAWLTQQAKGKTNAELSEALMTLVKACLDTGKKGTLRLTFTVEPEDDHLIVKDEIVLKVPEHNRPAAVWFYDPDAGALVRNDPTQPALFRS
jgi:hypothetical protein